MRKTRAQIAELFEDFKQHGSLDILVDRGGYASRRSAISSLNRLGYDYKPYLRERSEASCNEDRVVAQNSEIWNSLISNPKLGLSA